MLPWPSIATPIGVENVALAPTPSIEPFAPLPATVDTTPPGVINRITLL
jgi:hypothetical protein